MITKTVLITGSNRGIGLEYAKQYAAAGWNVLAGCRQPEAATTLHHIQNSAHKLHILPLDVSSVTSMQTLKQTLEKTPIDILINNAGILGKAGGDPFGKLYEENNAIDIFQVNTLGPLFLSELLADNIAQSEYKTIINISSDWGSIGLNHTSKACLYRASKAALNSITASMATVLKEQGIKVMAIHPGWVQTDMGGPAAPIPVEESVKGMMAEIEKLNLQKTGCYIKYTGEELPW